MLPVRTLIAAAVVGLAALGVAQIEWDTDAAARFLPDDAVAAATLEERATFGADDSLFVLVETDLKSAPHALLSDLERWRDELAAIDGITGVRTFLDAPRVRIDETGVLTVASIREAENPIAAAIDEPLVRKTYLRSDLRGTALHLSIDEHTAAHPGERERLVAELERWRAARTEPYAVTSTGTVPLQVRAMDAAKRDVRRIALPLALVVGGVLMLTFRSWTVTAATLVLSALDALAAFGTAGWLGIAVSPFSLIVGVVIFTVGLLDNVHLAHAYARAAPRDADDSRREAALSGAVASVFVPCAWTTVTTVAGFCVLLTSPTAQIRQFGALAAMGTLWALFVSFTILPAMLRLARPSLTPLLHLRAEGRWSVRTAATILASTLAVLAVTAPGLTKIRVESDFPRLFGDDHPITQDLDRIERKWGGLLNVSFLISPRDGRWSDPEKIERLDNFLRLLAQRELVTTVISPLDLVPLRGLEPKARADVDGLLTGLGELDHRDAASLLDPQASVGRVIARVRMMRPEAFPALAADLRGLASGLDDLFETRLAGMPLVYHDLDRALLSDLLSSFATAFAVIALLLLVCFRSAFWWIASLLPNIAPLWIALGFLGLTGTPFTPGLLLAPGMALGLVVDDTIHFVHALRREAASAASPAAVIQAAQSSVGAALALTSTILFAGMALLGLSEFTGNRQLAAVMCIVTASAWLADVIALPAILVLASSRSRVPTP